MHTFLGWTNIKFHVNNYEIYDLLWLKKINSVSLTPFHRPYFERLHFKILNHKLYNLFVVFLIYRYRHLWFMALFKRAFFQTSRKLHISKWINTHASGHTVPSRHASLIINSLLDNIKGPKHSELIRQDQVRPLRGTMTVDSNNWLVTSCTHTVRHIVSDQSPEH